MTDVKLIDLPEGEFTIYGYNKLPGNVVVFYSNNNKEIHAQVDGNIDKMSEDELFGAPWFEYDVY